MKFDKLKIILFFMLISQIALCQQPTDCKVVKKYENGCYLVQIGDNTYFAMTEKVERKILKTEKDLFLFEYYY